MLMAALRLNIPVIFVSGGPMEAGKTKLASHGLDLVDAMVIAADSSAPTRGRRVRAQRLPDLRFVLRHVHRQLDELPDRSPGPGPAGQRFDPGHRRPRAAVPAAGAHHRRAVQALLRRERRVVLPRNIANFKAKTP
jgi:hypothetical protein